MKLSRTEIEERIKKCRDILASNDELIRWIWENQDDRKNHIALFDCIKHLNCTDGDNIDDHLEKIIKELEKI
jgi:hypothetical protein